jgi:anti-sigma factor RsiW
MNQTHPTIEQIVDYLHGELPPVEDAAMHAHLSACPECEEHRNAEVAITEALRAHALADERELPPGIVANVRARVAKPEKADLWESLRAVFRPVVFVPIAAAVAVMLYFGFGARHAGHGPIAIDASAYVDNHAAMAAIAPFSEEPPVTLTSDDEAR